MSRVKPIRCLLGMLGTDVHSKGIRTMASWLRDQGIEVVYFGEHNTVDAMVNGLLQEDVDLLGLSFSSGGYLAYVEQVASLMHAKGLDDVAIMIGGQVHPNDHEKLRSLGVSGIFGAGTTKADVLNYIKDIAATRGILVTANGLS